jgi:hypothetical protein
MPDPQVARGRTPYSRTKIFISYRREGNAGDAERLYDELKNYFPARHLFLDVKSIEKGDDYSRAIETALASCDAFLPLIGPRWLVAADGRGRRRLDDPSDTLRREVSTDPEGRLSARGGERAGAAGRGGAAGTGHRGAGRRRGLQVRRLPAR